MNFPEKLALLFSRSPVHWNWPSWPKVLVARYLSLRASRWGISPRLNRLARGRSWIMRARELDGCGVRVRVSDVGDISAIEEIFGLRVYDVGPCPEPEVILDLGAHIGGFMLWSFRRFPRVRRIAVEPQAENFALLSRNLSAWKIPVESHPCAVGPASGRADMSGRFGVTQVACENPAGSVEMRTLRQILSPAADQRLLLKMDIEGMEHRLLADLQGWLPEDTLLLFEAHGSRAEQDAFQRELEGMGFSVRRVRDRGTCYDGRAGRGIYRACALT